MTGGGTETFGDNIAQAADGTGNVYQTNRIGRQFQYSFIGLQARSVTSATHHLVIYNAMKWSAVLAGTEWLIKILREVMVSVLRLQTEASYAVSLLFCELYFTDPTARLFNVTFNGQQDLLSDFSIFQAAGQASYMAPSTCLTLLAASWSFSY